MGLVLDWSISPFDVGHWSVRYQVSGRGMECPTMDEVKQWLGRTKRAVASVLWYLGRVPRSVSFSLVSISKQSSEYNIFTQISGADEICWHRLLGDFNWKWATGWIATCYIHSIYDSGLDNRSAGILFKIYIQIYLLYSHSKKAKFLTENLGPKLSCSVVSNVKILAGDDQRYTYPWWFQEINETYPNAMDYLYGFAVHYYADTISPPSSLDETKRQFPSKVIINTESCEGSKSGEVRGPLLGSFHRSVNYILSYMQVGLMVRKVNTLLCAYLYYFIRIYRIPSADGLTGT